MDTYYIIKNNYLKVSYTWINDENVPWIKDYDWFYFIDLRNN